MKYIKQFVAVPLVSAQMVSNLVFTQVEPVNPVPEPQAEPIVIQLNTQSPVPVVIAEYTPVITPGKSRYQEEQERLEKERQEALRQTQAKAEQAKVKRNREVTPRADEARDAGGDCNQDCVVALIERYSQEYGANTNLTLAIAKAESGFNCQAKNRSSTASGVYQYLAGTWRNTPEGRAGISVFDCEANVRAAIRHIAVRGTAPWNASKHAWASSR